MTTDELRAWIMRMDLDRGAAAKALGVSKRTIDAYVRSINPLPIPRPIELLCGYAEREREQKAAINMLLVHLEMAKRTDDKTDQTRRAIDMAEGIIPAGEAEVRASWQFLIETGVVWHLGKAFRHPAFAFIDEGKLPPTQKTTWVTL